MGKENAALRQWLGNKRRFADLFNGVIFDGEQIVLPDELEKMDSEGNILDVDKQNKVKEIRRHRDIVMKWQQGAELVVLACENQENVNYAMPVRTMLYDSLSYTEQMQQLWNHQLKNEKVTSEEFLSKFRKSDKLYPVITIILYYGKEPWDGSVDLYQMFGKMFSKNKKLQEYISNYRINLIDASNTENIEKFQTDLQEVLGMLKYRNNKTELMKYMNEKSEYFRHIDGDTYQVIRTLLNSEKMLKNHVEMSKGEMDMCKALQDLYDEGIEKGIEQGIEQGIKELIMKKHALGQSPEKIAEDLVENVERVRLILNMDV